MAHRRIEDLTHDETAVLVREYLMAGHMIDRASVVYAAERGPEDFAQVAIDEWMGASPIYATRMQRLLGFEEATVVAAMKGMQLEIGAPPEYLDFRMQVEDDHHGRFDNYYCGALVELEPLGDEMVLTMCHRIQDPTFDATVWATHPKMRMRPIHRPPRDPDDQVPHCAWTVVIDESIEDAPHPEQAQRLSSSHVAQLPLATIEPRPGDGDGMTDYTGPIAEILRLRDFAQATLRAIAEEVCIQGHLLSTSFGMATLDRYGLEAATEMVDKCFIGTAGSAARRLKRSLGLGDGVDDLATMFELHPGFRPRSYVDWTVETDGETVQLTLGDCPARHEDGFISWIGVLDQGHDRVIQAIATEVDPHWHVASTGDGRWTVTKADEPVEELPEVTLPASFTAATFVHVRQ